MLSNNNNVVIFCIKIHNISSERDVETNSVLPLLLLVNWDKWRMKRQCEGPQLNIIVAAKPTHSLVNFSSDCDNSADRQRIVLI